MATLSSKFINKIKKHQMERRQILRALAAFTGMSLLAPIKAFSSGPGKRICIAGLGGAGCRTARYISDRGLQADYICIGEKIRGLPDSIVQVHYACPEGGGMDWKFGDAARTGIYSSGERHIVPNNILGLFGSMDTHYFLFGSLGESAGAHLGKEISNALNVRGCSFHTHMTIPFSFESSHKRSSALEARKLYYGIPNVDFLDSESLRARHGNFPVKDAYGKTDWELYAWIRYKAGSACRYC